MGVAGAQTIPFTGKDASTVTAVPAVPAAKSAPASALGVRSLLDEPAVPPALQVANDQLTITATNASLTEVIREVAARTGMQVEGASRDQRVFGVYGPGKPADVLSALLYDSGYNVLMVGATTDGAPRRLVLSPQVAAAPAASQVQTARSNDDDDDGEAAEPAPQPAVQQTVQPTMVPPPSAATPGQIKTPQQMLEELQRMRQGQQPPPETPHDPQ